MTSTTALPTTTATLVLRDADDIGYETLSGPTWVYEDSEGCWIADLTEQPTSNMHGAVAAAAGIDMDRLRPTGYTGGGSGYYRQANEYDVA